METDSPNEGSKTPILVSHTHSNAIYKSQPVASPLVQNKTTTTTTSTKAQTQQDIQHQIYLNILSIIQESTSPLCTLVFTLNGKSELENLIFRINSVPGLILYYDTIAGNYRISPPAKFMLSSWIFSCIQTKLSYKGFNCSEYKFTGQLINLTNFMKKNKSVFSFLQLLNNTLLYGPILKTDWFAFLVVLDNQIAELWKKQVSQPKTATITADPAYFMFLRHTLHAAAMVVLKENPWIYTTV